MSSADDVNLLPGPPAVFVDRTGPLGEAAVRVDAARARETSALLWLTGPEGVGKTTLALYLAHDLLGRYGDVKLYYELGGSAPGGRVDPSEILAHWLRVLGRDGDGIPAREEERRDLFRSLTAGRRVLMLLDDVHDGAQVERLLPSSPESVVIVTSRRRHDRLHRLGFQPIELGTLTDEHAVELLAELVSATLVTTEPEAVRALIGLCGGLPLALSLAAVRIRRHRERPFALLVDLLRERSPLEVLHLDGERVLALLLDTCAADLTPPALLTYGLLGLHPGPDFGVGVVAALLGGDATAADDALDELCAASLLRPAGADRFRFHHALIARHAHRLAMSAEDETRRLTAIKTMIRWYADRAVALARVASGRWWVGEAFARLAPAFTGPDAKERARADLDVEQSNLQAAVRLAAEAGLDDECAQLCEAIWPLYYDTDRDADLLEAMPFGVAAADRLGPDRLRMRLHHDLGAAYERSGRFGEALTEFRIAGRLAEASGDVSGEESATEWQGLVLAQDGAIDAGLDRLRDAWRIAEERVPDPHQRARMLALLRLHMARLLTDAGRPDEARPLSLEAYAYFDARDEPVNTARAAQTLGRALVPLGRSAEGQAAADRAVALFVGNGFRSMALRTLRELADAQQAAGSVALARDCLGRAEPLAVQLGLVAVAEEIVSRLAALRS